MVQLKLNQFCETYNISRSTAMLWIQNEGMPAYKLGGRWYIDIGEFVSWRSNKYDKKNM